MSEQDPSEEKPRGVEVRVIGGEPPAGWEVIEDRDEVVRLVKSGVKGARSVDEVGPGAEDEKAYRSGRKRWGVWKWTLVMGTTILVSVAVSVTILIVTREDGESGRKLYEGVEMTYEVGEDPDDPFVERATGYLREAREKLRRLATAEDLREVASILRHEPGMGAFLSEQWKPPDLDEDWIGRLDFEIREDGDGHEWLVLSGKDSQSKPVRFIFVPRDDELLFDWAASVGANFPTLRGFRSADVGEEADFRVEVREDHFYTSDFPEDRFSCYKLTDVFADAVAWGYVAKDSAVAEDVAKQMHLGGSILESESMARMLVRLRKVGAEDRGQFELIDVVAGDWIRWQDN